MQQNIAILIIVVAKYSSDIYYKYRKEKKVGKFL